MFESDFIMGDKNLYSYAAIKDEPMDFGLFPEERWRELVEGIREEYYPIIISVMADQLSHYWPKSGTLLELSVHECLLSSTESLLEIPSMGKKKARTVILILTYLFENLNHSCPTVTDSGITDKPSKQDYDKIINSKNWDSICNSIPYDSYSESIQKIAFNLGLKWSGGFWGTLTIGRCIESGFNDLCKWRGFGKKRRETLFAVLIHLAKPNINTGKRDSISVYDLLKNSNDDWQTIALANWQQICGSIPKKYHKATIQTIANDLGLKWPERNWGTLTVAECFEDRFMDLFTWNSLGKKKIETIAKVLIHLTDPDFKNSKGYDSRDIWSHPVIVSLTNRKREIFEGRLLTVYEKPTLQELGDKYGVHRERIRQLEGDIKKKIATSGLKEQLKEHLKDYIECELKTPYMSRCYLLRSEVPSIANSLSPELILAIALDYKSIYELLSRIAQECPFGWYFGKRSEFRAITKKLEKNLEKFLPAPYECLANKLELEPKKLVAVSLLNRMAVSDGTLMLPQKTGRADSNRAARCFYTAISSDQRFWEMDELIEKSNGPLSPQNQRLCRISISRSPRLFISTPSYVSQLDHSIHIDATIGKPEQPLYTENEDIDNGNYSTLHQLLDKEWPITRTNIREYTSQAPYQTTLSDNSLILSLRSIPGCTRLAPGIYAPKNYLDHLAKLKKARKLIMDEWDIRAYCFARRAGEKCEEIFPLWDAHQEQLWFRKLQKKSEDDPLLRSFISVSLQKEWPEQLEAEKLKLMEHTVSAKFLIEPKWIKARSYKVPDLATTLTALRYANEVAPLSWIRANHITCTSQPSKSGVSPLCPYRPQRIALSRVVLPNPFSAWISVTFFSRLSVKIISCSPLNWRKFLMTSRSSII